MNTNNTNRVEIETKFMSEYTINILALIYKWFKIDTKLESARLPRTINKEAVAVSGELATALKLLYTLDELLKVTRSILRRISTHVIEELEFSDTARGRIAVKLAAKHLPANLPMYRIRILVETPANLLLEATLIEICNQLQGLVKHFPDTQPALVALRNYALEILREQKSACDQLLYEPMLRPLLVKAKIIASNPIQLKKLEKEVELEVRRKPRELGPYLRLLDLRKLLRNDLLVLRKTVEEHGKTLTFQVTPDKLYEWYGLALLLNSILDIISDSDPQWKNSQKPLEISKNTQELKIYSNMGTFKVSYNFLPEDMLERSKIANAESKGLLQIEPKENSIKEYLKNLHGIPDTIVKLSGKNGENLLLVDYKYTRSYSYLSQARFKMLAYLYEYNADYGVIITPKPREEAEDEESKNHKGFYDKIADYQGAILRIYNDSKVLAIVYADPNKEEADKSIQALKELLKKTLLSSGLKR
jgi:hypothetical protein